MTATPADQTVLERLARLLDLGLLPAGGPAEAAERLMERLKRPARVALLGLPGAGKSAILNLLAGTIVVPETLRLPTIVVQHGLNDRMLCTLADGRTEAIGGHDLSQVLTRNPALVTVERDLPALKVISLLEVSAGPLDAEQRRAAIWASKRADLVIWCTTSYLPKEQVVWESMPDVIKDNGFLFLTKTDLLGNAEAIAGMLQRIEQRAGEEFRQVFAISAKAARAAMPPGGAVDRDRFRESGAAAVISTIKARVQAARRADIDTAEVLLARHVQAGELVARRFAVPETAVTPVAPVAAKPEPGWTPPPEPIPPHETFAPETSRTAALQPQPVPVATSEDDMMAKILAGVGGVAKSPSSVPLPPPAAMPEFQPTAPEPVARVPVLEAPTDARTELRQNDPLDPAALASPGGRRLSDRLRQPPEPEEIAAAATMPLRTTWKSRGEAPASAASLPAANARARPGQPPGQPLASNPVERPAPQPVQSQAAEPPIAKPLTPEPKPETPATAAEATDRGGRVSVFSAGRPATEPGGADSKPAPPARTASPMEPVTRVRGPAPSVRAAAAAPMIAPEDLASPRISSLRDRQGEAPGPERRERPRISARVAEAPAVRAAVAGSDLTLLDEAIALIIARSADLAARIDPAEKLAVDLIIDHGRRTIEAVSDILLRGTSPGLRRISTGLGDVLDLIMLMQLEKGYAPADDTLTLILQIRRDLETLRAA